MFVRIHFDAASLFPAILIMASTAVTLKNVYVVLEDNMASRLNGRYNETYEVFFGKNGNCIKLDKKTGERELKNIRRKRK